MCSCSMPGMIVGVGLHLSLLEAKDFRNNAGPASKVTSQAVKLDQWLVLPLTHSVMP